MLYCVTVLIEETYHNFVNKYNRFEKYNSIIKLNKFLYEVDKTREFSQFPRFNCVRLNFPLRSYCAAAHVIRCGGVRITSAGCCLWRLKF